MSKYAATELYGRNARRRSARGRNPMHRPHPRGQQLPTASPNSSLSIMYLRQFGRARARTHARMHVCVPQLTNNRLAHTFTYGGHKRATRARRHTRQTQGHVHMVPLQASGADHSLWFFATVTAAAATNAVQPNTAARKQCVKREGVDVRRARGHDPRPQRPVVHCEAVVAAGVEEHVFVDGLRNECAPRRKADSGV